MLLTLWCKEGVGQTFDGVFSGTPHTKTAYVNDETSTVNIKLYEYIDEIASDLGKPKAELKNGFYIRWYIEDASGNPVALDGWTWSFITYDWDSYNSTESYYYWSSKNQSWNDFENWKGYLNLTLTIPNGLAYSDYKIVCVMAGENGTYNTNVWPHAFVSEPSEFKSKFIFGLKSISDLVFTPGTEPSNETVIPKLIEDDATSTILNLYTDKGDEIKSKYSAEDIYKFYLKWYLRDKESKDVLIPSTSPFAYENNYSLKYSIQYGLTWYSEDVDVSNRLSWVDNGSDYRNNFEKVFKITYSSTNLPEGKSLSDYEIVCVMTNNFDAMVMEGGYLTHEPAFQQKYVYQLITKTDAENAFTEGSQSGIKTIEKEVLISESESSIDLTISDDEFATVKTAMGIETVSEFYLRWYLEDATTGDKIELAESPFSGTADSYKAYRSEGLIWNNGNGTTFSASTILKLTYGLPTDKTWKDYNVVCLMTDGKAETLGDYILQEPDLKLKYTFKFVTRDEVIDRGLTEASITTLLAKPTDEAVIVIDNAKLEETQRSITFNTLFTSFSTNYATVFGKNTWDNTDFYLRWFLVDANNNVVKPVPDGALTDATSIGYQNTQSSGWVYKQYSSFNNGLKLDITYNRLTDVKWEDYKLACVMTTDMTGLKTVGDIITAEPTNIQALYLVKFKPIYEVDDYFEEGALGTGVKEHTYYQLLTEEKSFEVNLYSQASQIVSDLGFSSLTALNDNFYLRWYIVDRNTRKPLTGNDGKILSLKEYLSPKTEGYEHAQQKYGMIWTTSLSENDFENSVDDANILNAMVTLPDGYTQADVALMCVLTNDLTNLGTNKYDGLSVHKEPTNLKAVYTCLFITEEEAENLTYKTSALPNTNIYEHDVIRLYDTDIQVTLPLNALYNEKNLATVFGSQPQNFYLRWFLRDAAGNVINVPVNSLSPVSAIDGHQNKGSKGLIWSTAIGDNVTFTGSEEQLNVVFKKTSSASWETYQVVCVMTDDLTGYETVGSVWLKEPSNIKAMAVFTFDEEKDHFRGYGAETERKSVIVDHFSTAVQTLDLTTMTNFAETKNALVAAPNKYFRWFVTDKNGERVEDSGITITVKNSQYRKTPYGYIWYSGEKYANTSDLNDDLWTVEVQAAEGVNINEYNVACVFSTDMTGATFDTEGNFTKEPDAWMGYYIFDFQSEFDGLLADGAKTIYKTLVVADDETSSKIPLYNQLDAIAQYFRKERASTSSEFTELDKNFHIRWFLMNEEGNIIPHLSGCLSSTHYYENQYGIYWNTKTRKGQYTKITTATDGVFDVLYTLPDDAKWSTYKVVVVMTDDNDYEDGTRTEFVKNENAFDLYELTHEPNHLELRYIIDFKTVSEVQSRFVHYKGYTNSDFTSVEGSTTTNNVVFNAQTGEYESVNKDIRQQTHEWTYEIYVEPEATKNLILPILNGNSMEPQAYYRWYDWNTDKGSSTVGGKSGTLLSSIYSEDRGLFGVCLGGATIATSNTTGTAPTNDNVGVVFTAPSAEWNEPIVIACDISKYGDGMDLSETYLVHEPTLSYRYKYIIRPARMIADAIKEGVNDPNDNLLENHGDVTIGISGKGSTASLRLNLSSVDNYYFYPYTLGFDEDGNRIESWSDQIEQATNVFWRVYDASELYYRDMGSNVVSKNGLFFTLSQDNINGTYNYKYAPNTYSKQKYMTFETGENFYVFAYASDGTNSCPIARFNCRFSENYPIAADEVVADQEYRTRTVDYLDQHYSRVGLISFDVEEGGTLSLPTFPLDNLNPMPFKWNRSHYGYCYPDLYPYLVGNAQRYYGLSPIHGDYTLIKSMNLDDVSENGSGDGYLKYWWKGDKTLRDLTYRYSAGAQNGYFIYVDASEESRPIANVAFEGEMCVGSTLVLSAMVADMTSGSEKPQLIFKLYGIKTDVDGNETERKLVHSFATCNFSTVGANTHGTWYQVYAKVTLQNNSGADQYKQFIVSIDNYCSNTDGADYAIDDIRIYTQNSKVEVKQNSVLCADEAEYTEADIMIKHETLLAMMPSVNASDYPLPVYYRICDENGNPLTGKDFYGAGMDKYGEVDFRYYFYDPQSSNADEKDMGTQTAEWLAQHYQKDVNGNRYFVLNEKEQTFKLEAGKKYYISLALPTETTDGEDYEPDEYTWGKPTDVCSMYSDPFQPLVQSLKLTVGTNGINRINVDCHKTKTDNNFAIAGILQVPDPVTGELVNIDDPKACHFDWIVEVKGEESEAEEIKDALAAFRNQYGKQSDDITYYTALPTEAPGEDVTEGFTKAHYETLQKAIADGRLYISASTDLVGPIYHVGNTYVITAIPLESKVTQSNGTTYDVCPEPMEVTVEARLNGPELNLGFEGIRYADAGLTYGADGLRVGQKQLQDMQSGKPLHLPINAYKQLEKNSAGVEEYVEYTTYDLTLDDFDVIVWDSNDPTWTPYLCKDIDLYNTDGKPIYTLGKEAVKHITNENRSVELQLHQNYHKMMLTTKQVTDPEDGITQNEIYVVSEDNSGIEIKYHEGYWYKVKFRYSLTSDLVDPNLKNRCYGESYLTIKVVPEYATWGEGLPNNSNWLNDDNWRRSSKAELYKTVVNSDNYPVYDETTGLSNEKGYVPMSFTKVTILNDMQTPYPYLSELKRNVHTNLITEETLTNGDLSAATVNIQYDMMVGAEPTTCPYNKEKTNVYECEHFYGNICEQIYFKPRAQLRYQHYLDYEKAWVEMELSANKWMMLTSPFEQLYAGDFYVPAVEEGGTYPYGRQETEAFQDINFGDKSGESALYSRNGFPIYQRSWDKTNSMVVTAEDDALREDYDAFIDYEWTEQITSEAEDAEGKITTTTQTVMKDVDVVATQWSHVYNDMEKLYEPGRGFSIRLHHTDRQEENGTDKKALLRFPKADTQYRYYDHADKEGHDVTVDKNKHHRLAADGVATGMVQITPIENANGDNPYYMVGNPYMASVRMELFFNANPHLVKTYWVVSNGAALSATEATGLGIIGPMQSFFVKTEDGQPVTNVLFSPAMTVSHLVSGAAEASETDDAETISFTTRATANVPMAQTRVVLSAEADNGFVDEEDVETLLDSNLEDVPMVYTVAGTQAAMVNCLNDVTLLPLGLFGAEGETVDVQVHGVDRFSQTLYFYDASTGKQTVLEEGTALSLEANVHGRYFLTTRALEDDAVADDTDWQVCAYSLQRGELIVAAMPQDNLRQVRIYGVNGHQVVNDATVQGHVATYALPSGIYVAEVVTERLSRPQVVKVVVR